VTRTLLTPTIAIALLMQVMNVIAIVAVVIGFQAIIVLIVIAGLALVSGQGVRSA